MKIHINRRIFLKLVSILGMSLSPSAVFLGNLSRKQTPKKFDRMDVHHHILPPAYTSALAKMGVTRAGGVPFPNWNENPN